VIDGVSDFYQENKVLINGVLTVAVSVGIKN